MSKRYLDKPIKVVFDTNIYIAAIFAAHGYCKDYVYEAGLRNRFVLYSSVVIMAEVESEMRSKRPDLLVQANTMLEYVSLIADLPVVSEIINVQLLLELI
jgi:predicted nucleic acid-binding protein